MKVYIAGKITGDKNYKEKFERASLKLQSDGHNVMNPAILPDGFDYEDYMPICFAMIDVCDAVLFLDDWKDSGGAKREYIHATSLAKKVFYHQKDIR